MTGSFAFGYDLGAPITVSLYGNRTLNASAFEQNAIFVNQELGAAITGQAGQRLRLAVNGGFGENDYPLDQGIEGLPKRLDDVEEIGAGFGILLFRNIWLNIDATRRTYDSNIDQFDRDVFRVATSISTSFSYTP